MRGLVRWHHASLRAKTLLILATLLLPLLLAVVMLAFQTRMDLEADRRITANRRVRDAAAKILRLAVDAETGVRGFVATGDPVYLEPYRATVTDLNRVGSLVEAAEAPDSVLQGLREQYRVLRELTDGSEMSDRTRDQLLLQGKDNMDELRSLIGAHVQRRANAMQSALDRRDDLHRQTAFVLWAGGIVGVLGGSLGITLFMRDIIGRVKMLQENSRQIATSEPFQPIGGNDEIGQLGRVLASSRLALLQKDALRREAEAEMIRSRDAADRANRAKSEFLSRMSHELRTPLNSILGFAQLLEMGQLKEDQRESVHYIVKGGKHLLDLINEVLDIARIESGQLSLSLEPVALKSLVEESIALMEPLAAERDVRLSLAFPAELEERHVIADGQRLKQIVLNLLSNGIKYNRQGGSVTVTAADVADRVLLEITDTGLGLSSSDLESIFTPFDRLGAERSETEGTGLGLALSKSLAEAMGGDIVVDSQLDVGSSFILEFERAEDPVHQAAIAIKESLETIASNSIFVLYIEDNASNLKLVERVLARRPGIELLIAMQGRLGLDLAREHRPDLVLLDVNLPDIDGGDVLLALKSDRRTAAIPVVVLSADATPGQVERLMSAGAVDYLTKPIDVARFLKIVDRLTRGVAA